MEHSALHGAQLIGMLVALAAPLFALLVLLPARRRLAVQHVDGGAARLGDQLAQNLAVWAFRAAAVAAGATLLNLVVQVAEIEGLTILAGADPALLRRFVAGTTVGRISIVRGLLLVVAAGVALALARRPRSGAAPWAALLVPSASALIAASLVGHAAALPSGRPLALALHLSHLVAGAAWVGALTHLLAARALLRRARSPGEVRLVAEVIGRFSPIALTAAGTLLASGGFAAVVNLGSLGALVTSAYGLTLAVKLILLLLLIIPAWTNFRVIRPGLERAARDSAADPGPLLQRFSRMLELEVTCGLLVVAVAGILGSVSPPLPDGTGRLTPGQTRTVLTPRPPQTNVVDPATWVGSEVRTDDDLRYSEFMHNWSGLIVVLLGLAWLVQAAGGTAGQRVGRFWPLALIPFAAFVAIASDPEVWPMGTVDPIAALTDPVVLEHRIGAVMIVVLAWLGFRDERRTGGERPLGRSLPILMVAGSLLLLGHAHSSFGATESLSTLINVQHAILGALGLFAGVVRWLELRGLFPRPVARVLWPSLVIAVGAWMGFFYRELT